MAGGVGGLGRLGSEAQHRLGAGDPYPLQERIKRGGGLPHLKIRGTYYSFLSKRGTGGFWRGQNTVLQCFSLKKVKLEESKSDIDVVGQLNDTLLLRM